MNGFSTERWLAGGQIAASARGGLGRLRLNRPEALHALNAEMCAAMIEVLLAFRADPMIAAVMIDHREGRGFCAGGDIRMLAESGSGDARHAREFFRVEYRLNHLLHGFPKPVIAIMDGITMGGGVGISVHTRHRIATERTRFAMPETGIGLFPDVGGGWFLPRLPGGIGVFLALTGARLDGAECHYAGLADCFIDASQVPALAGALETSAIGTPAAIGDILAAFHTDPGPARLADNRAQIDRFFTGDSVEAILSALADDPSLWAQKELATLRSKSPQALKVALRQIKAGAQLTDFAANMAMEYRIACRVVQTHDFAEGVRAVIIDKDHAPRWAPATLAGVSDELLDSIFARLPDDEEWSPL